MVKLLFPKPDASGKGNRYYFSTRRVAVPFPEWPWQELAITFANCFMLWSILWIEFVFVLAHFSYRGAHLWLYTTATAFGLTLPELFLLLTIGLSIFAVVAVAVATWGTKGWWKRMFLTCLSAAIALWFSGLVLQLRGYAYSSALHHVEVQQEQLAKEKEYYRKNSDPGAGYWLEQLEGRVSNYQSWIQAYQQKYGAETE